MKPLPHQAFGLEPIQQRGSLDWQPEFDRFAEKTRRKKRIDRKKKGKDRKKRIRQSYDET